RRLTSGKGQLSALGAVPRDKARRAASHLEAVDSDSLPARWQGDGAAGPGIRLPVVHHQSCQSVAETEQHAAEVSEEGSGRGSVGVIQPVFEALVKPRLIVGGEAL